MPLTQSLSPSDGERLIFRREPSLAREAHGQAAAEANEVRAAPASSELGLAMRWLGGLGA
jgi:hypothetical protein